VDENIVVSVPSNDVTTDEDYQWLTDRLDAQNRELIAVRELCQNQYRELSQLLQTQQDQSRTLIQAQSEMIAQLLATVTSLSESVLSKLTPPILEVQSPIELEPVVIPEPEVIPEIVPAENAPPTVPVETGNQREKKRRRI
jgi:hypothetical protein